VAGVEAKEISREVGQLLRDFKKWNSTESSLPLTEIAARLLGGLLRIHPFIEGNDRIARLFTDIFLRSRNNPIPKWPAFQKLKSTDKNRKRYFAALQAARRIH
jgi:fido (protein-threonine AMPylation protein)